MKSTTYLSNLTPLRGIAAILTVVYHIDLVMGNGGSVLIKITDSMLLNRLYLMVDFFFILSGFIMLHVYGAWFKDAVTGEAFKRFTFARFARVYPLHFITLIAMAASMYLIGQWKLPISPIITSYNSVYTFFTNLFLVQSMNLHEWYSFNHAAWSISTEWWAYMLFPFLVKPFSKLNSFGRVSVVLACFAGYLLIIFVIVPDQPAPSLLPFLKGYDVLNNKISVSIQFGFLRCLCGFVIGMMMYAGFQEDWCKRWLANGYTFLALTLGLFLCLHFGVVDVFAVSFFPFMLLSAAYGSQNMNAFFSAKPLQKLGDWSFSIYLTHQPLLFTFSAFWAYWHINKAVVIAGPPPKMPMLLAWEICIPFVSAVLIVSYLTYTFVEVPARRWINAKK